MHNIGQSAFTGGFVARHDWCRNSSWNADIESDFRQRLRRARDKSQYLRIQASHLAESHPQVALSLLDQYFALGDHFDKAQAYVDRARAFVALDDLDAAISSYEAALTREREFPHFKTYAYLDYACLVTNVRATRLYVRAMEVLDAHRERLVFPVDRYLANGARAILLQELGRADEARIFADRAMAAAREVESGFRYHKHVGLVKGTADEFGRRVAALGK
jgi:tetratricopeptide (TPR) repeat protein